MAALGYSIRFEYEEQEHELHSGDIVLMTTDDLPERLNSQDEELGYSRTYEVFKSLVDGTLWAICEGVYKVGEEWARGRPQDDDIIFVVLKVKAVW